ncbi:MAG TPA: endonuclease/exonuclease/phosphatase family protein [Solirubrobacteraceae bacterium]|nr:endonuclease/exonuclease/phosphatase family protein [Solirubrobacteraceae bacterium]
MKVLTWNLYHGRAVPPAGRDLFDEFASLLASWAWDAALLQEVPPWWPRPLAERAGASMRMNLTGRNQLLVLRRFVAERWPDIIKANGGGSNAILVRGARVVEHREERLRCLPEQRWMHAVRLEDGPWLANLHAQTQPRPRPERDIARAVAALDRWTRGAQRVVLGGDFNIGDPSVPGMRKIGGGGVDFVFARGYERVDGQRLERGALSDHAPLLFSLRG